MHGMWITRMRRSCHLNWLRQITVVLLLMPVTGTSADTIRIGGTGSATPAISLLSKAYVNSSGAQSNPTLVPNLGSSGSLRALEAGALELAVMGRRPKANERQDGLSITSLAATPFVLVTSRTDTQNITTAELADYLSGRQTTWPDKQPVRLVLRPQSDGDTKLLASLAPEVAEAVKIAHTRPGLVIAGTDQEAAELAEKLPGSLSVSSLALIHADRHKLQVLSFNGVAPSTVALREGRYPFAKQFILVSRQPLSPALSHFIAFSQSPTARKLLESSSHVILP